MARMTTYADLVAFHGHSCPGLAIGYRMSQAALARLHRARAEDEEIVAIVENDACGVDALQCLSGCTFGKGNLIFKDYGKHVYTLYDRRSRRGVRVLFTPGNVPESALKDRDRFIDWLLTAPEEDVVSVKEVQIDEPEPARIMDSAVCESCGEAVMATRTRTRDGRVLCIPCDEALAAKTH
jgi:formylmethanofuran dehydrogenase subunit E